MLTITNINQILPAIRDKAEFIVIDKGEYKVVDYVYQASDTFDTPESMECRGIKFDKEGLILARPFRKFFNYGERGTHLPIERPHIITDKMDGSMVHPVLLGKKLFLMTRKGYTDVAKKAERFVMSCSDMDYIGLSLAAIKAGWTPIFEYVGPDNRIVLRYDDPSLILLAMRHIHEGYVMSRSLLCEWSNRYGVPVVERKVLNFVDVDSFVQHTRGLEDAEGYVVYFDDGHMVKVKAEDYVLKHRALDDLSSKKKVVALCCQGFADDVLPILSEADKTELIQFDHDLQEEISLLAMTAESLVRVHSDRKIFALQVAPNIKPKWLAGVCFGIMDGKNARQLVLKAVEKNYDDLDIKWRGQ